MSMSWPQRRRPWFITMTDLQLLWPGYQGVGVLTTDDRIADTSMPDYLLYTCCILG